MHRNEAGEVVHVTDKPVDVNQSVTACVDWDRRLDHMQQHTGQAQTYTIASSTFSQVQLTHHMHRFVRSCQLTVAAQAFIL